MSEETLFTAARRALRDFSIDMNAGGLISTTTEISFLALRREVDKEEKRLREAFGPRLEPIEPETKERS